MYLTIEPKIKSAMSAVQSIAGGKTQMPILQHLLLQAETAQLTMRASNEEMSLRYRVPAPVQAPGSILLPANFFAGLVHDLPQAPLTLITPSPTDATAAHLRCQKVKANVKLGAMSLEEFPAMPIYPDDGGQHLLTMDCELLREVIDQVAFAAATHDSSRPVMEGIHLTVEGGRARFAAADAFRLALRHIAIPDPQLRAEIIISAQSLRALARLLPSSGSVVIALSATESQILFHTPMMDAAMRLIAGTFPAYGTLLVAQPSTRVVVQTQVLAEAVRLSAPFARENGHQLHLRIIPPTPGEAAALVLEAQAPDLGSNEIRLDESLTVEGAAALTMMVHDTFLAEALAVVPSREVLLELTDARHPIAIKPVGPLDHVSIVMPLIVSSSLVRQEVASVTGA